MDMKFMDNQCKATFSVADLLAEVLGGQVVLIPF